MTNSTGQLNLNGDDVPIDCAQQQTINVQVAPTEQTSKVMSRAFNDNKHVYKMSLCSQDSLSSTITNNNKQVLDPSTHIAPTFKRYIILLLFCVNSGNKAFQWIQVPAITTKATVLYGVDNYMINLASIIFMLAFLVLSWPACYIIDTLGMRRAVLMASCGTAIGACIKCFSCHESGIWLLMIGQIMVSLGEQLIFSVPTRLASVWFPDYQVSLCVAMCVVGNQLGVALGFQVPQWFLDQKEGSIEIGEGFYNMFLATATFSVVTFILCLFLFDEEPLYAPGEARLAQRNLERQRMNASQTCDEGSLSSSLSFSRGREENNNNSFCFKLANLFHQVFRLCHERDLMLLALSFGIVLGIGYTIQTLLDQMITPIWLKEADLVVGNTGFLIIVAGALATPVWGRILDKWHWYKFVNIIIACGTFASLCALAYAMSIYKNLVLLYVTATLYGLFQTGFTVSGLEYAVELTYPAPELVTSSVMNVMPQLFGTLFILIGSHLVDAHGPLVANTFYASLILVAIVLLLLTRQTLKRQEAIAHAKELQHALERRRQVCAAKLAKEKQALAST